VAVCPSCGKENPDGFQFCGFCTTPLTAQPALPVQEERKVVSVLFCDLVGFTAASEQADPEDVRARLRPYHARVREEIERYSGTVEKFVGDAVMAVFGAPVAHEDDAERAVRAGLRILEAIAELNEADAGLSLQVRVGVNTGEAVVALGARPELGEGLVTGDVVNTAARLQSAAPVGGIAVSEQTYRATERVFDYEALEPVSVKGKAEPLAVWRPLTPRARFGTDVTRTHTTPLVGRELERPLLVGTFERAAGQRSCQLVTVVGEPGVGKSRLCMELFQYLEDRPGLVRWRQGRCLPYGEGVAFWALGEIVKAEAGILESDSQEETAAKLEAALPQDDPDLAWLRARLGLLVGAGGEPAGREESFTAWRRVIGSWAAQRETVLVFEDLHWADEALLAFLDHLADWSEGVPLLVLCTARPELFERHPSWAAGLRNATTINLPPLSDEETARLLSSLLEQVVLPAGTQRALVERAGGNPLYAEEFVRLLADRDLLGQALEGEVLLPESVQALIAARLDTLSQDRKSLLQDAAVVGKVFWAGAVCEMGGRERRDVELALHELSRKELVRPARSSSMAGEAEYGFWHLLVRDVCYGQIRRAARASRHRAAAGWIEQKAAGRVEDLADVLAHHYTSALELAQAAGDSEQATELAVPARRYLALAGERALGLDTAQAEAKLARALELTPTDNPERPELLLRWADAAFQAGRLREAADALEQALTSLRTRGDADAEARTLILLSDVARRLGEGRYPALAVEAVRLLEQAAPGATLVAAYTQLTSAQFISGNYTEAIAASEHAMSLAERLGLPVPARAVGFHGSARALLGDPDGLAEMERALALLIEQGAGRNAAVLQNNLALARYPLEGPARSLAAFEQGIAFSEQRGLAETATALAGNCPGLLVELGHTQQALERAATLAAAAEASGDTFSLIELRAVELATRLNRGDTEAATGRADWLIETARKMAVLEASVLALGAAAAARLATGQPDQAQELLTELDQTAGAHETPYYPRQLAWMVRTALAAADPNLARILTDRLQPHFPLQQHALVACHAQLAEATGDHAQAATLYADAAQRWSEFGNFPEHAHALRGHGHSLLALDHAGAEQSLTQARELFRSMGYRPALAETEALLEQTTAAAS
jgi:class 3 adenylate cyclase/tetratricopeptide (TPR) repeat protein